ncbi:MAG: hypothetical protein R3298_11050 [Gammaproteobacteria bacterium]|nr:hypothetical protein [Gammaproteobacteria bacterium]
MSRPPGIDDGPLRREPPPTPEPVSPRRWKVRAISSLIFALPALAVGSYGLVELISTGEVTVLPNRPAVGGRDAVEAVSIYLGLGAALLAWGLYALRRARR